MAEKIMSVEELDRVNALTDENQRQAEEIAELKHSFHSQKVELEMLKNDSSQAISKSANRSSECSDATKSCAL